jgi:hypothetical protein
MGETYWTVVGGAAHAGKATRLLEPSAQRQRRPRTPGASSWTEDTSVRVPDPCPTGSKASVMLPAWATGVERFILRS